MVRNFERRSDQETRRTIKDIAKAILKEEGETRTLLSLKKLESHQEERMIELLNKMGQQAHYLEKRIGRKINFSIYC
jgi:hypothetical protein